jgi:hypothetical protein
MIAQEAVNILEEWECNILDAALRTYLSELYTIKGICRKPVFVDGVAIEEQITMVRELKKTVHARTTKGRAEHAKD